MGRTTEILTAQKMGRMTARQMGTMMEILTARKMGKMTEILTARKMVTLMARQTGTQTEILTVLLTASQLAHLANMYRSNKHLLGNQYQPNKKHSPRTSDIHFRRNQCQFQIRQYDH
jgi:hypothetical protein